MGMPKKRKPDLVDYLVIDTTELYTFEFSKAAKKVCEERLKRNIFSKYSEYNIVSMTPGEFRNTDSAIILTVEFFE